MKQSDGPDIKCAMDARVQQEFLRFRIDAYLRGRGWIYTSDTPGNFWLWSRELDNGRTILVPRDTAISIQESLE